MTAQLAENRRRLEANASELREKNLALEERRHYIETVLQTLSTGVVSLDEENRVTTINAAALAMLRLEQAPAPATPLSEIVSAEDFDVLERVLWRARPRGRASEQMELARGAGARRRNGGAGVERATAVTQRASSPSRSRPRRSRPREDDGAARRRPRHRRLVGAARRAARRRLERGRAPPRARDQEPAHAHPALGRAHRAQLPRARAEATTRGAAALDAVVTGGGTATAHGRRERERVARVVEECTATISREVAGLKAMVDEFTRFARLPHARLAPADLNEVVRQVGRALRRPPRRRAARRAARARVCRPRCSTPSRCAASSSTSSTTPSRRSTACDGERRITVATAHDPARGLLIAEVADTGHGIARADFARLFQPYFSTRGRGTGLGLAIVHRIMAEHGGRIRAESNRPRGARMIIELPVAEEASRGTGCASCHLSSDAERAELQVRRERG